MLRYTIIRKLYPLLSLIANFYYAFVNAVFMFLSTVKPKQKVEWTNEELNDQLLFLSAKEAAEKIRQKQVGSILWGFPLFITNFLVVFNKIHLLRSNLPNLLTPTSRVFGVYNLL